MIQLNLKRKIFNLPWVARQANTGGDRANAICKTPDGGLVVTGQFSVGNQTSYNADGSAYNITLNPINTSSDTFLCKYETNGTVQWNARVAGDNQGADLPFGICANQDGKIFVIGTYSAASAPLKAYNSDASAFGSSLTNDGTTTLNDIYICQYNQ